MKSREEIKFSFAAATAVRLSMQLGVLLMPVGTAKVSQVRKEFYKSRSHQSLLCRLFYVLSMQDRLDCIE